MSDPSEPPPAPAATHTPATPSATPSAASAGPATRAPLENAPPAAAGRSPAGGWALNLLVIVAFALFAFSAYWLYLGYRQRAADAALAEKNRADEKALLQGAMGPSELQPAADTALRFLKQRPEFLQEIGELLQPDQPVEYRMQLTAELGSPDDVKFRMTLRGAKSHAWYDTILRPVNGGWQLLSASLTVPDSTRPDGRKLVRLLDPPATAATPAMPAAPAPPAGSPPPAH